jgi:hypothetical protein
MGKAVAAVAVVVGAAAIVVATGGIGGAALFQFGAAMALGGASQLLAPKPQKPEFSSLGGAEGGGSLIQQQRQRLQTVRSSVAARQIIYGETVVSGVLVAAFSSGADNEYIHLVLALAGHEVDEIKTVWFDDTVSTDSRYTGLSRLNTHTGTATQAADTDLVSDITEWTTAHQLKGIAYLYARLKWDVDVWLRGIPNIKVLVKGKKIYDPRDGLTDWTDNPIICQRDFLLNEFNAASGSVDDTVIAAQANVCDEDVSLRVSSSITSFADAGGGQVTVESVNHGLSSGASVEHTGTTNYNGSFLATNITVDTYEITATWVSDDATGTWTKGITAVADAGGGEVTVTVVAHRLANGSTVTQAGTTDYNGDYLISDVTADTYKITATWVSSQTGTISAANQDRYVCNGQLLRNDVPINMMERLKSSCAGTNVRQQGVYKLYAGAYVVPTVTLTADDLRGDVQIQTKDSRKDLYNGVKGEFINAADNYLTTNFPPLTNSSFETDDGGVQIIKSIELPFTDNGIRAQRLAKIVQLRSRQGVKVVFPAKMTAFEIAAWDTVNLTLAKLGWTNKTFRVLSWSMAAKGGIDLELQEESSTDWAWLSSDELAIPDPVAMTIPDPYTVTAPASLTLTSGATELIDKADGTQVSRIKAAWTTSTDQFVLVGGFFEVEFKKNADSVWLSGPIVDGLLAQGHISDVDDGVAYDVRVRAVNSLGRRSAWSTSSNHTVVGKAGAPSTPTGLSATARKLTIELSWTDNTDSDLAGYDVQRADDSGFSTNLVTLSDVFKGTYYIDDLGTKGTLRYYRIRAVNRSGNASSYTSGVSATTDGVDTEQVVDNAVTVSGSARTAGSVTYSTSITTLQEVTITTDGNTPVAIWGSFQTWTTVASRSSIYDIIHVGTGTTITSSGIVHKQSTGGDVRTDGGTIMEANIAMIGLYTPTSSGSHTFRMRATHNGAGGISDNRNLVVMELKK